MDTKKNEMERNRPADEGSNNDPNIRGDSALQPGISTVSSSESDELNGGLTETASDDFRIDDLDDNEDEDARFDEIGRE